MEGSAGPRDVVARVESMPETAELVTAFRTEYPVDYRQFSVVLAVASRRGGDEAAAHDGFLFLRRFMAAKEDAVANAPEAQLVSLAEAYLALARLLRAEDVGACAQLAATGFRPGQRVSPAVVAVLSRLGALQIRAARAGENGLGEARGPLSGADTGAWVRRMWAIDPAAAALVRSASLATASPARQCDAGVVAYQAAAELPDAVAANVMAELIRPAPAAH